MSKLDRLKKSSAHVRESMGADADLSMPPPQAAPAVDSRYQGVAKLKNAAIIEVARIRRDENQPREEFDREGLERLAASMKSKGQLQPIQVRWDAMQDSYMLIAGERRWRAAQLAGLATVNAVIHEGDVDAAELLEIQLIENVLREDLRPIEQARAYQRLMASRGWSGNQLAKELSINQSHVSHVLKLLELPEQVQARVEEGSLSQLAAYEVTKLADPAEQVAVAEQVVAGRIGSKQVRTIVKERRAGKTSPPGRVEFRHGPYVVTVQGPVQDAEPMWAALRTIADSRGKTTAA